MNRRGLLGFLLSLPVAGYALLQRKETTLATFLSQLLPHTTVDAFRAIGQRFIALYPEHSELSLVDSHLESFVTTAGSIDAEMLSRQIRADYQASATFVIDGWVLSRTELYLCARQALSTPDAA
jgi:hypothetical protein